MPDAPNPWDRPKNVHRRVSFYSSKPPPDRSELHLAVGRALSTWALIETHLCDTFCHMFDGKSKYAAYKIYGTNPSTSGRITVMRIAGEAFFSKEKEHWEYMDRVLKLAENFLSRRNDIAHGVIEQYSDGTVSLVEPHYSLRHKEVSSGKTGYELSAKHVEDFGLSFMDVANEIYQSWSLLFPPTVSGPLVGGPLQGTLLRRYVEPQRTVLQNRILKNKSSPPRSPASPP